MFDSKLLDKLAVSVAEVLFDAGEMNSLEKKVNDRTREQVSRILIRYQEHPESIREIEEALMSMDDPDLAIALLQQAFLIRSERTQNSIVDQLVRLANSTDKVTSSRTLDGLKEAAYSDIPRLSDLGCQAAFQSDRLSDAELLSFIQNAALEFENRIRATEKLVTLVSPLGGKGLVALLDGWRDETGDVQRRSKDALFSIGRKFDRYESRSSIEVSKMIQELYLVLKARHFSGKDNTPLKVIQNAMATLPRVTINFLRGTTEEGIGNTEIFTLGECARRNSEATLLLFEWARTLAGERSEDLLQKIAFQLKKAEHSHQNELRLLIDFLNSPDVIELNPYSSSQFDEVLRLWQQGKQTVSIEVLLTSLADEFEEQSELTDDDMWQLRVKMENGDHKRLRPSFMSPSKYSVLVEALKRTNVQNPWRKSFRWWIKAYNAIEGQDKLVVLDALGQVALSENRNVLTNSREVIVNFFQEISGSFQEEEKARDWIGRLTGDVLPESIETNIRS